MVQSQEQTSVDGAPPRHVAIIMDGNRRWADKRHLPKKLGHKAGVDAVRNIVRAAGEIGVRYLTLYGFSSENWNRGPEEVSDLMGLLRLFIRRDLAELHQNGVKVLVIGERTHLEPDIVSLIEEAENLTADNQNLVLTIAFNYGGHLEIAAAVRRIAAKVKGGELDPAKIDPAVIESHLDTAGTPHPDLVIRTSGERRLSNFLLWQSAYSEFVFTDVLWPDFDRATLEDAIREFQARDRRFGEG